MARTRSIGSLALELVAKSREAALCAIRVFNDPHVSFKSETFIVLMVVAWTYMLHAYYRRSNVEYRYFSKQKTRKKFDRTGRGDYKYWELERCLNAKETPIDKNTASNLRFLIGLRHEIEHQMTRNLDSYLSARYQACALNYNNYIKKLFGKQYGLDSYLSYSIQFLEIAKEQISGPTLSANIPDRLRAYLVEFDSALTPDEFNSPQFACRLIFTKKLVNRPGQADCVVEFVDPTSEIAKAIDKEYWVKKEVERKKFRPSSVVAAVNAAGYPKFRLRPDHTDLWKAKNAKDPKLGYGAEVEGIWYWYESWVKHCIEYCDASGDKFKNSV